jgi:hypothetical protein
MLSLGLLILLLVSPASAFHDSNLEPRYKQMLDQMMRADPQRSQMYQQQGNMMAAMQDRCQRGDQNACAMFNQGKQEVDQWAQQMGGGVTGPGALGWSPPPQQSQAAPRSSFPPPQFGPQTAGPIPLTQVRGNRCNALGPQGWRVFNERNEGDGVDFVSSDATLGAAYLIAGIPSMMLPTYGGSPESAVKFIVQNFGQWPSQFSPNQRDQTGFNIIRWQNQHGTGLALWYTFPLQGDPRGFVLVIRTGVVTTQGDPQRLREAVAVATSIRCTVGLRPPPPADYTSRPTQSRKKPRSDDEAASEYNAQLGMEYVHDKTTGENYWVSPSTDYRQNGPEGPGYYKQVGNDIRKLTLGRSD